MGTTIIGISSMATKALLNDLALSYRQRTGVAVAIESVGGVDAARRVQAGEAFDVVVLASDAIDKLLAGGHAIAGSRTELVRSPVAVAVRAGAARPDIGSEQALKAAVLNAPTIGWSTGPSGVALAKLFDRWGISEAIRDRIVQAPPGVPVGSLVARGDVALGFQQSSELMNLPGIDVIGGLPEGVQIVTTFSAAVCTTAARPDAAQRLIDFMASSETADTKRRHGMQPA